MKLFALIIILLQYSICTSAQDNPKTWLWQISKPGVKHRSYILGTYHEVGNHYFDSLKIANKILLGSDIVAIETLDRIQKFNAGVSASAPDSIRERQIAEAYHNGMQYWAGLLNSHQMGTFIKYVNFKKNETYILFTASSLCHITDRFYSVNYCDNAKINTDTIFSMDEQIKIIAQRAGKPLIGLDDEIEQMLQHDGNNIVDTSSGRPDSIWAADLIDRMELILNNKRNGVPCSPLDEYTSFSIPYEFRKVREESLFGTTLRNRKWVETVTKQFSEKSFFIAVGFQHLRYNDGLIQQFRNLGYKVTPQRM